MNIDEIKKIVNTHASDALDASIGNAEITDVSTTFSLNKSNRPSLLLNINYMFSKDVKIVSEGEA